MNYAHFCPLLHKALLLADTKTFRHFQYVIQDPCCVYIFCHPNNISYQFTCCAVINIFFLSLQRVLLYIVSISAYSLFFHQLPLVLFELRPGHALGFWCFLPMSSSFGILFGTASGETLQLIARHLIHQKRHCSLQIDVVQSCGENGWLLKGRGVNFKMQSSSLNQQIINKSRAYYSYFPI